MPKKSKKAKTRRQVAALPWRPSDDGRIEILLATSRETRRAVIPKGWPMKGLSDRRAAATEALEEVGVVGEISRKPVGRYPYWKRGRSSFVLVEVDVYPLRVVSHLDDWKEKGQRDFRWMPLAEAAELVDEPVLSSLIAGFSPDLDDAHGKDAA